MTKESDLQDHKTDGLTAKQRMFCHEYIVDFNGTQAAIRAGYSENTASEIAHENLRKPQLSSKIQQLMDERAKRTEITADKVINEIYQIAQDEDEPQHKLKALELTGKHLKLFSDKIDLTHSGDVGLIFEMYYGTDDEED